MKHLRQAETRVLTLQIAPSPRPWQGIPIRDAIPIPPRDNARFDPKAMQQGLHVWEPFGGSSCSGLVSVIEARYPVRFFTHTDICKDARHTTNTCLPKAQVRYPGLLPTSAIWGFDTRIEHDISQISNDHLTSLVKLKRPTMTTLLRDGNVKR